MDPRAFRVLRSGRPVALEPKAFQVLLFLLENPGRLVEKRELLDRVWQDTVVTESAMTRVIADLRKALGDAAHEARYIETVPTKGYRFIATVRRVSDEETHTPAGGARPPRRIASRAALAAGLALGLVLLILIVRAAHRRPAPAAEQAASLHTQQVTDSLGLDLFPTFSPDGAQIAYTSERGSGFEIYVRQLAAGGREIQITSDGLDNLQPAWSPDGREIAYFSRGHPGIWLVPALGGAPRRLTDVGSHPTWSPDGKTIAFQSTALGDIWTEWAAAVAPASLLTVDATGGTPVPLTRPGSPAGGHGAPSFSPNGEWIAFATFARDLSEIWRVSRDGRVLERVTGPQPGPSPFYYEPVFSPRGDWLYFASSEPWLDYSLYRVRVPARPGDVWGKPELVRRDGATSIRYLVVSPDGTRLAYSAPLGTGNLWSLPVDPVRGEATGPPVSLTRSTGCRSTTPAFSPDGSRIAFLSCRRGSNSDVWVMEANGERAEQVTSSPEPKTRPYWFPEGNRIAFVRVRGEAMGLWSITLPDRRETLLSALPTRPLSVRISPDGRSLAFTAESNGIRNIWVRPIDGGAARQVTFDREGVGFVTWSPDGQWLATELIRGADSPLVLFPAYGGMPRIVTEQPGTSWPNDFSPNGERILFAGLRAGLWNVYWISRNGGPEHRLTAYSNRHAFVRYPLWSPRGNEIVYEYAETTGNIWLMDLPR